MSVTFVSDIQQIPNSVVMVVSYGGTLMVHDIWDLFIGVMLQSHLLLKGYGIRRTLK